MLRQIVLAAAVGGACSTPVNAQIRDVEIPARNWGTIWGGMYTNVDGIADPESGLVWAFDDNVVAFGAGYEREVSQGLLLGAEASYSATDFEGRADGGVAEEGTAKLIGLFATGRLRYGGTNRIGGYLKGAAGSFGYQVPGGDGVNFDLALSTGAGLEYRFGPRTGVYLEWNRLWAYHEKEGIDGGNTGRHSLLRLGLRRGF